MEMQILAQSWPLLEVRGEGLLFSPPEMTPLPKVNCESGQEPSGKPRGKGRAREGGVGSTRLGPRGSMVAWGHRTFSEYTAGAPRGLRTSRLGPAYVCSRLAP